MSRSYWFVCALAVWAACRSDRERPTATADGPNVLPDVTILDPRSGEVVPTPGPLSVAVQAKNTLDLLESVSVKAVRFANAEVVAHAETAFARGVGDTLLTLTLDLEALPDNTQLDLTATVGLFGGGVGADTVPVIAVDCTRTPWPFCP